MDAVIMKAETEAEEAISMAEMGCRAKTSSEEKPLA